MKLKEKNTLKILAFFVGITAIAIYLWYIYDYVFNLDKGRQVKIFLFVLAVITLVIPWEVLYKLSIDLSKIWVNKFVGVINRFKKSYTNFVKDIKSQNIKISFQPIVGWTLVVIVANIIYHYFIREIPMRYELHIGINFIVLLTGILLFRKLFRFFFVEFFRTIDNVLTANLEKNFIRKPNIIKFVTFLMLIGVAVTMLESWIYKPEEHSAYWDVNLANEYANQVVSRIEIQ